jgi:hypothetical protein
MPQYVSFRMTISLQVVLRYRLPMIYQESGWCQSGWICGGHFDEEHGLILK